jgi:hypothetical protein
MAIGTPFLALLVSSMDNLLLQNALNVHEALFARALEGLLHQYVHLDTFVPRKGSGRRIIVARKVTFAPMVQLLLILFGMILLFGPILALLVLTV